MSLHHIYSTGPSTTQDITAYVRLYQYSSTTDAKEGSVAHSTMVVDDPDGILDFVGHRRIYSYEDLAPAGKQVVHNGYIFGEKVSRGPYRNGPGRIWTLDIADTNVLLNRRIMNGSDANRAAETDVQRMTALQTMTELNTIDDFLYFSSAAPVAMDAVDYRGQPAGTGYIDDCRQASGKNAFAWYREATGENSLWYDFASSTQWSSLIRLSNVLSDVSAGSNTFAVDMENAAELDRDPSRVASGIFLPYDGVAVGSDTVSGSVYVQNAATTATFGAIDWAAPSTNVKTQAKAIARANRYLADAATEDDLIRCSVKLPASNVNDILAGMRVEARFSHLPDYNVFSWLRCLSRTVTEISEDPTKAYRLDLELSPQPVSANFLLGIQSSTVGSLEDLSTHGWTRIWWNQNIGGTSTIACGAGPPTGQGNSMWIRAIVSGETTTVATFKMASTEGGGMWVYEIAGCDMSGITSTNGNLFAADGATTSVTLSASATSVLFGAISWAKVSYDGGWNAASIGGPWGSGGADTDLVTQVSGTQLVNKSSLNNDGGNVIPWTWIGYAQGTGALTVSANANSHGGGAAAYSCGYNVGRGGVLIPVLDTFSIVQSAFGGSGTLGAVFNVVLPAPPTPG